MREVYLPDPAILEDIAEKFQAIGKVIEALKAQKNNTSQRADARMRG
jgi:hypothetical protein